jgi:hypothetical protein
MHSTVEVMQHPQFVENGLLHRSLHRDTRRVLTMGMSIRRGQPWHGERLTVAVRYASPILQVLQSLLNAPPIKLSCSLTLLPPIGLNKLVRPVNYPSLPITQ